MNKYHNKKITVDGLTFDSKREATRWSELKLLQRAGEIYDLQRQVPYIVIPKKNKQRETKYIADFRYMENGKEIVEDSKGFRTPEYMLKKKLMYTVHDIEVRETK